MKMCRFVRAGRWGEVGREEPFRRPLAKGSRVSVFFRRRNPRRMVSPLFFGCYRVTRLRFTHYPLAFAFNTHPVIPFLGTLFGRSVGQSRK
jgi:hypothetical protein